MTIYPLVRLFMRISYLKKETVKGRNFQTYNFKNVKCNDVGYKFAN